MTKRLSESEKLDLVDQYNTGKSIKDICGEYKISKSTLYNWIHEYSDIKTLTKNIVSPREYANLLRKLNRLEQENQIFKLSQCIPASPLSQKLEEIKCLSSQFPIRTLCKVLVLRRSTFYHYILRKSEITQTEKEDVVFRERIADIFEQSRQRFAAKKLKVKLRDEGHIVSIKRIQRLMNELGLKCNREKPVRKFLPETQRQYYRNKLNRAFKQISPNRVWVSDIT